MVPADRILAAARDSGADLVGLSGLITPSLEEMAHVAGEMERQAFTVPLLIGGATTSRAHTAVRIAPAYKGPVVHVLDASRAVGVVSRLKGAESRAALDAENRREQERLRAEHAARRSERPLLPLEEARRRRTRIDWAAYEPPRPCFQGPRELADVPLRDLVPCVDWTPFYFAHPQSRYFALGRIGRDQALDYHRRKGLDLRTVERWLAPNLGYDPADA
jgi:5-methyltetrahydrofolate--homocysteine methyltransferase